MVGYLLFSPVAAWTDSKIETDLQVDYDPSQFELTVDSSHCGDKEPYINVSAMPKPGATAQFMVVATGSSQNYNTCTPTPPYKAVPTKEIKKPVVLATNSISDSSQCVAKARLLTANINSARQNNSPIKFHRQIYVVEGEKGRKGAAWVDGQSQPFAPAGTAPGPGQPGATPAKN